jgi:protein-tyrosine-phosphatase
MAEYLLKAALRGAGLSDAFDVCSAGTAAVCNFPASEFAVLAMEGFNGDIAEHTSRKVTQKLLDSAAVIFCSTETHRRFLLSKYKKVKKKCFLIKEFLDTEEKDIADPFCGALAEYEMVRDEINSAMASILNFLTSGDEN